MTDQAPPLSDEELKRVFGILSLGRYEDDDRALRTTYGWFRRIKATIERDRAALERCREALTWRPITLEQKTGAPLLMKFKDPIPNDRDDLRRWDGLIFVGRHPGLADDGFDIGWNFAAPVGVGGFPDGWFEGWRPLAAQEGVI